MKEIERLGSKNDKMARESIVLSIVKLVERSNFEVFTTKITKFAFLTQVQNYVMNSEEGNSGIVHRYMWIVYQLCKVIKKVEFFIEVMY